MTEVQESASLKFWVRIFFVAVGITNMTALKKLKKSEGVSR